jgi:hypothetical protein
MTDAPQTRKTTLQEAWSIVRFIVFGFGGLVVEFFSWISLLFAFGAPGERWLSPLVSLVLSLVGALMMLYGVGYWGRWAYLWVFFSIPLVITPLGLLASRYPGADWLFAPPVLMLLVAVTMPVSYLLVRIYYKRREAPQPSLVPPPQITNNEEGSR